jgi:hypothetical protein
MMMMMMMMMMVVVMTTTKMNVVSASEECGSVVCVRHGSRQGSGVL